MAQDIQPTGDRIAIDVPSQPYAPSWVDRLAGWVRRRLRASWFFYTALAVILLALQTSVVWVEGALPVWTFLPPHIFLAIVCVLFPGLIQYLDGRAASALESLRPALMVKEAGYSEIRRMITTLPARMTLMAGVLAVLFALLTADLKTSSINSQGLLFRFDRMARASPTLLPLTAFATSLVFRGDTLI